MPPQCNIIKHMQKLLNNRILTSDEHLENRLIRIFVRVNKHFSSVHTSASSHFHRATPNQRSVQCICCGIVYVRLYVTVNRVAVMRERGGTPFRQIFWSRNGAAANIVGHIWNANTEAFQQITSYSLG